jgi:hypothetical protein
LEAVVRREGEKRASGLVLLVKGRELPERLKRLLETHRLLFKPTLPDRVKPPQFRLLKFIQVVGLSKEEQRNKKKEKRYQQRLALKVSSNAIIKEISGNR